MLLCSNNCGTDSLCVTNKRGSLIMMPDDDACSMLIFGVYNTHRNERHHCVFNFKYFTFNVIDPNWTRRGIM